MKSLLCILVLLSIKSFGQDAKVVEFDSIQDALASPTKVKSLDLSNQNLTKLPAEIVKLTNLEEVDLGSNPNLDLAQAFDVLKQISSLKIIWLHDGKINAIPDNLSQIKYLEELYLDNNELKAIPESIRKLKSLKILSFFNNNIKTVEFKKGDLPNLITIDLCYNQFQIFPVGLSVLPSLKRIIIWDDSISEIPSGIRRFKHIEAINLENNNLRYLPRQLGRLKSLQYLSLRGNKLSERSLAVIYKLSNLKKLDLQGDGISVISRKITRLKKLEDLSLCDNPLVELPNELGQVKTLQQLGLGDLPSLNWARAFSIMEKLTNLRRVGMYSMKLSKMPSGFEKLQQIDTFWLTYNWFDNSERIRIEEMVPKAKIDFD